MEENAKSIQDIMQILRKRRWSLILPMAVVFLTAVAAALLWPPTYRATSTILIEEQEIPREFVTATVTSYAEQRLQNLNQRIMSSTRLLEIVSRFNLYADKREKWTTEEIVEKMRKDIKFQTISADVIDRRTGRPTAATIAFSVSYEGGNAGHGAPGGQRPGLSVPGGKHEGPGAADGRGLQVPRRGGGKRPADHGGPRGEDRQLPGKEHQLPAGDAPGQPPDPGPPGTRYHAAQRPAPRPEGERGVPHDAAGLHSPRSGQSRSGVCGPGMEPPQWVAGEAGRSHEPLFRRVSRCDQDKGRNRRNGKAGSAAGRGPGQEAPTRPISPSPPSSRASSRISTR